MAIAPEPPESDLFLALPADKLDKKKLDEIGGR